MISTTLNDKYFIKYNFSYFKLKKFTLIKSYELFFLASVAELCRPSVVDCKVFRAVRGECRSSSLISVTRIEERLILG